MCYHASSKVLVLRMLCQFCNKDKTLIEAHIITRCLHEPLLDPSGPMMVISKDANPFPKRTHTGQYDSLRRRNAVFTSFNSMAGRNTRRLSANSKIHSHAFFRATLSIQTTSMVRCLARDAELLRGQRRKETRQISKTPIPLSFNRQFTRNQHPSPVVHSLPGC